MRVSLGVAARTATCWCCGRLRLGLARTGEEKAAKRTLEPIAAEAWGPPESMPAQAVVRLAPGRVLLPAGSGRQGGRPPGRGRRQRSVEPPAAVPAPTAVPILASRHGDLRQAALAFLDAWYARADDSDNSEDTLNGRSPLSARPWQQGFADPLGRSFTPSEGDKAGAGSGHAAPSRRCQRTGDRGENGLGLPHGSRLPCRPGKKGVQVDVLERVRQTDPNKQRARESHTVYRFAGETAQ
jgi:hypothetical protein